MFNLYRNITVLFVLAIFLNIHAVENVSSVNAYQSRKEIVITYELFQKSDVIVYVSTDGGKKYHTLQNISGDFGKDVEPGNKQIYWDVLSQYDKFIFSEVCFKIESIINNGHEYVDLDLPSGTLWATCNVGASKPEEYGYYFAWGENSPKSKYNWETYKWSQGTAYTMTKYCTLSSYGKVDNKKTLEPIDDAASVNWGGNWRMPTKKELDELCLKCKWEWTTFNGVNGYKVTSKTNGNSIFLPAAGYRNNSSLSANGSYGFYWSSSLRMKYLFYSYILAIESNYMNSDEYDIRSYGLSVRAVLH